MWMRANFYFLSKKSADKPGTVAHTYNLSTWDRGKRIVCGYSGLHIECQASQGYIEKNKSANDAHNQNVKKQNGTQTGLEV